MELREIDNIELIVLCLIIGFILGMIYEHLANRYDYNTGKLKKKCDCCCKGRSVKSG